MSWTLCSSAAATAKAGANKSAVFEQASGALIMSEYASQAEGIINTATRKDWTAAYASVGANFKPILADVCSDLIAMKMINYDMGGYTNLAEATSMLDVLRDNSSRSIDILKLKENQEKM